MRKAGGLAMALLAVPVMAWAEDFVPPAGCEALLTVQSRNCIVRVVMRCADFPEGFDVARFGPQGSLGGVRTDAGTLAVHSTAPDGSIWMQTGDVTDPMDVRIAVKAGQDAFDFEVSDREGTVTRYAGTVFSDGAPFDVAGERVIPLAVERTITVVATGEVTRERQTLLYYPPLRLAFGATDEGIEPARALFDQTPVAFLGPGEAGFLSMEPQHGCQ